MRHKGRMVVMTFGATFLVACGGYSSVDFNRELRKGSLESRLQACRNGDAYACLFLGDELVGDGNASERAVARDRNGARLAYLRACFLDHGVERACGKLLEHELVTDERQRESVKYRRAMLGGYERTDAELAKERATAAEAQRKDAEDIASAEDADRRYAENEARHNREAFGIFARTVAGAANEVAKAAAEGKGGVSGGGGASGSGEGDARGAQCASCSSKTKCTTNDHHSCYCAMKEVCACQLRVGGCGVSRADLEKCVKDNEDHAREISPNGKGC